MAADNTGQVHGGKTWTLFGADGKPYQSTAPGTLGGYRAGKRYGRLDCRAARQAMARGGNAGSHGDTYVKNRVFFLDEATAIQAGYRPCGVCLPAQYAAWKAGQHTQLPHKPGKT